MYRESVQAFQIGRPSAWSMKKNQLYYIVLYNTIELVELPDTVSIDKSPIYRAI